MGKIDVEKLAAERAKRAAGSELLDVKEGETLVYVCAFPREADDMPYVEYRVHYSVGLKGKFSHMCLEPSVNKILLDDGFLEQVALLKKSTDGGCPTCERLDRGETVSPDPEESGKPQSRWLFIVVPRGHRSSPNQNFTPWKDDEVKGLSCSYGVWDGIMDQFGQLGDITDMDGANLLRLIREGTKKSTKWEVQNDAVSIKKPVKLPAALRELIVAETAPGGPRDPMRIVAAQLRDRADIERAYTAATPAEGAADEYEQPAEGAAADGKGFKPPTKGAAAKPPAAASKPAAAKQVAATKPSAGAGATKPPTTAPAKAAPAKPAVAKANAALQALIKQHGSPPGCYEVDPDPGAPICVGGTDPDDGAEHSPCPFNVLCFEHCGVQLPEPEAAAEEVAEEAAGMTVEQCVAGESYTVGGTVLTFKGPAKGKFYFTDANGKAFSVAPGTAVEAPIEEAAAEETAADDEAGLQKLEAELAARKASKAAKK
jgi:hypothetical protein